MGRIEADEIADLLVFENASSGLGIFTEYVSNTGPTIDYNGFREHAKQLGIHITPKEFLNLLEGTDFCFQEEISPTGITWTVNNPDDMLGSMMSEDSNDRDLPGDYRDSLDQDEDRLHDNLNEDDSSDLSREIQGILDTQPLPRVMDEINRMIKKNTDVAGEIIGLFKNQLRSILVKK